MEKQSNTMQCIPSFFVLLDKIATFVKSVQLNTSGTHTFGASGKGLFSCNEFGGFLFHVFHSKRGVIRCISCKNNWCHIKFAKQKLRFENKAKNKLETGIPPLEFCQKIYIVYLFGRNENLLLCTPLVYMHEYGPYKTLKKYINEVSLHISGWTDGQG